MIFPRYVVGHIDLMGEREAPSASPATVRLNARAWISAGVGVNGLRLRIRRIDDRPLGRIGDMQLRGRAFGIVERLGGDDRDGWPQSNLLSCSTCSRRQSPGQSGPLTATCKAR
jgi:hypothetical protein